MTHEQEPSESQNTAEWWDEAWSTMGPVFPDRDDLLEIRRETRIDPRHGTHPEHTCDALGGAGMVCLDVNAVPLVADVMLTAEPRQRIP